MTCLPPSKPRASMAPARTAPSRPTCRLRCIVLRADDWCRSRTARRDRDCCAPRRRSPGPPCRVQFQCGKRCSTGLVAPPRLVVVVVVLRKAARVHHAEVRADARPLVRRRLAAIVEAGPDEAAGEPGARREVRPPRLRRVARPPGLVDVVGADVAAHRVVGVDAARRHGACRLRAEGAAWRGSS